MADNLFTYTQNAIKTILTDNIGDSAVTVYFDRPEVGKMITPSNVVTSLSPTRNEEFALGEDFGDGTNKARIYIIPFQISVFVKRGQTDDTNTGAKYAMKLAGDVVDILETTRATLKSTYNITNLTQVGGGQNLIDADPNYHHVPITIEVTYIHKRT